MPHQSVISLVFSQMNECTNIKVERSCRHLLIIKVEVVKVSMILTVNVLGSNKQH